MYVNTCKSHLAKLIILNNKLLRITENCLVPTCIVDLYEGYSTLPLSLLQKYNVLCFVHKRFYNSFAMPLYFNDHCHLNNVILLGLFLQATILHTVNSLFGLRSVLNSKGVFCGIIVLEQKLILTLTQCSKRNLNVTCLKIMLTRLHFINSAYLLYDDVIVAASFVFFSF